MIEYFYSAHSAFAYLGSARLIEIAKSAGHEIAHKPINLRRVMIESGAGSTRDRSNRHRAYYFGREIERWAEWRNAPVVAQTPPTHHHNDMTLCNGMIIAGIEQGHNVNQLAHRMLEAHWRDDADLADLIAGSRGNIFGKHGGGHSTFCFRVSNVFRRRRHVLWPRSSGTCRTRLQAAFRRCLAAR